MHNEKILNGLAAIHTADQAYQKLYKNSTDAGLLSVTAAKVLEYICTQNEALLNAESICNGDSESAMDIGIVMSEIRTEMFLSLLQKQIPALMHDRALCVPVRIDVGRRFVMSLEVERQVDDVSVMAQFMLLSALQNNNDLHFYCADTLSGGNFFTSINGMILDFSEKTGGRVFKNGADLDHMLDKLEKYAETARIKLSDALPTVSKYNQNTKSKLPEFVHVLCLSDGDCSPNLFKRLWQLVENREKNGMSFIIVGNHAVTSRFAELTDIYLRYEGENIFMGEKAALPFSVLPQVKICDENLEQLKKRMQEASIVNTVYAERTELHTQPQTMYSEKLIRIPFAVDKSGTVQYFELGGIAPPHALISGRTGSGKSVALHSLIMQIIYNYHPDDVEVWAIDYKAVEFKSYLKHPAPHFRMIGLDTSTEFSLSFIDFAMQEYESRQKKFVEQDVKNIEEYREKMGRYSMPRIVVFIDEFQFLTQAVQESGDSEYRTKLENLLRLTRAMGIAFVFCSQTVSKGLSGLTDAGRQQIECRLCLMQDESEARETLALSGPDASETATRAKNLQKGQALYKRTRLLGEARPDGNAYEILNSYILYTDDALKNSMIDAVWENVGNQYQPKDQIIVESESELPLTKKIRHPIQQFVQSGMQHNSDDLLWYPAAPTTLQDAFTVALDNTGGANILLVGENNDLRESIVVHSLCGFLMQDDVRVVVSVVDENNVSRDRLIRRLQNICSERLKFRIGVAAVLDEISALKKIRPSSDAHAVYLWYGLDKLKNEIFLMRQDMEEADEQQNAAVSPPEDDGEALIADLLSTLAAVNAGNSIDQSKKIKAEGVDLSFEDCCTILQQAFDMGPENGQCHFVLFNNRKTMKKSGMINLNCFENRIGTKMSNDDSYELFDSTKAVDKTDDRTVIYYTGSGKPTPLRPYKMPETSWYAQYNARIAELEGR